MQVSVPSMMSSLPVTESERVSLLTELPFKRDLCAQTAQSSVQTLTPAT